MSIEFALTLAKAAALAVALPVLVLVVTYVIVPRLREKRSGGLLRYLSYLIIPPTLGVSETRSSELPAESGSTPSWRRDKVRLYFYYLGVVLFVVSFAVAELYEVLLDLLLPVSQGSTGEFRVVYSLVFQNLFAGGWVGSLPWFGLVTYHETWDWIFFTSAFTDNPSFLLSISTSLTLLSFVVGLVYLAPLALPRVRKAFVPSMFFFMTGSAILAKSASSCLAYAVALAFFGVQLEYGSMTATGSMILGLYELIAVMLPIVLLMLAFTLILGRRLWRTYFADTKSRRWFTGYMAVSFWLGVILTAVMV